MKNEAVVFLGDATAASGAYLLRIEVMEETAVRFGRFRGGEVIQVPAGTYLYVGSAMRGLGGRLLRHASRTEPQNPHPIRPILVEKLRVVNIIGHIPQQKRLHWHVDYLLERPQAALTQVIVIRSRARLEERVAAWLMGLAETAAPIPGLGASDHQGYTHLLRVPSENGWWLSLPGELHKICFVL